MSVFADYAQYYDIYYAGKDYDGECDFIEAAFARFHKTPHTVLDLACGTGNHGLRLRERGYAVTGVDRSAAMLEQCRKKAKARNLDVDLYEQDLRELKLQDRFDAAICMFDAIDYIPENEDLRTTLCAIRSHLQPGGVFLFDFWHAAPILRGHDPVRVREFPLGTGKLLRISTTTLHVARQVADVKFRVLAFEGNTLTGELEETHSLRYFQAQEMAFILEACGFEALHLCPAFDLDTAIDADTWHLVAIATPAKLKTGN